MSGLEYSNSEYEWSLGKILGFETGMPHVLSNETLLHDIPVQEPVSSLKTWDLGGNDFNVDVHRKRIRRFFALAWIPWSRRFGCFRGRGFSSAF